MSRKANKVKKVSAQESARRAGSKVAVAAFLRSGAGAHGNRSRRTERRAYRQTLRRRDWD